MVLCYAAASQISGAQMDKDRAKKLSKDLEKLSRIGEQLDNLIPKIQTRYRPLLEDIAERISDAERLISDELLADMSPDQLREKLVDVGLLLPRLTE